MPVYDPEAIVFGSKGEILSSKSLHLDASKRILSNVPLAKTFTILPQNLRL